MSALVPSERAPERAIGLLALAAGTLYVLSAAPGIQVWDTAELAAAGYRLGPSHPPGQPLHSILVKLATLVPLGSIAFRANVLSAVSAALAVWLTGLVALKWSPRGEAGSVPTALAAAGAFAASGLLVNQATRAEVYAPAVALYLFAALQVSRAVRGPGSSGEHGPGDTPGRSAVPWLAGAGLAAGLAAMLHVLAGLSAGVAGLAVVVLVRPRLLRSPRVWVLTLLALVVGVLPLCLIVLRCRDGLEPCWASTMTPATFYRYVTGAAFRHNVQSGGDALAASAAAVRYLFLRSGVLPGAVLGVWAVAVLARRSAPSVRVALAVVLALGAPLALVAVQPFHPENPDTQGYLLPALALLFAGAANGAASLGRRWGSTPGAVLPFAVLAAAVLAGDALASLRPSAYLPGDVGTRALGEPRPKALVMAGTDAIFFAMQYGQLVEGMRPDVALMASGLSTSSRSWLDAARRRPEIALDRVRPRGTGDAAFRWARGALDLVEGVLPRWVEDPLFDVHAARSTGVLFDLDAPARAEPLPRSLAREHGRRGDTYADGTDAMMRLLYLRRAFDHEAHGELAAAAAELRRGLFDEPGSLPAGLADFAPAEALRMRPLTPLGYQGWLVDAGTLRAALARVLFRGGRTDLAVSVLRADFRAGNPQAALALAEIELREGRVEEAEALYRAFAEAHPERRGYAIVGLALVRATRGDRDGAEREIARVRPGDDAVLKTWVDDVARQVIPALAP